MNNSKNSEPAKSITLDNKVYLIDDINDSTKSLIQECIAAENNSKNKQLEAYFANIARIALIDRLKTSLQDVKFTKSKAN